MAKVKGKYSKVNSQTTYRKRMLRGRREGEKAKGAVFLPFPFPPSPTTNRSINQRGFPTYHTCLTLSAS
ncbi:unnamed protein product [Tuber melanosporum]|uniref:(Perigord truffle) hypothetical protein n=1 Tax=Tuber melanosporum (strain Mel28) TaxID=656061 RepID=D5G648_TUBMM|nr:uncharacterized protein GSTUM_00001768001 [Tuber melanosporum]CAZ79991.1 unnamed protein product [Tuber melanosporum]